MLKVYASYYNDNEIRKQSSSGGIFTALALQVILENGIVYGVAMSDDCYEAEYVRVCNQDDLGKIRGSKYLQAKLGNTFHRVQADLLEGKKVLFTGTGCQINGLRVFLGKEYELLICVDVICHGVPSPLLWKKHVQYLEKKKGKLLNVNFRSQEYGFGTRENKTFIFKNQDFYLQMFLQNCSLRPSCYACKAKEMKSSDLSIADFWGIETIDPAMKVDDGCSLVLIRTEQGEKLYSKILSALTSKEVSYEAGVKYNPAEYVSPSRPEERERFYSDMDALDFKHFQQKYIGSSEFERKVKNIIKIILKKIGRRKTSASDYGLHYTFEPRLRK